ncbi:bifunctional phosphoglucose/phosphomannose isomerase [Candidatus Woesearchaeota archaeon]|nr:bifunctional phosphoglucose/phosphomannose isomerase [Candidatus Woesearchaeota archaeon]
MTPEPIDSQNLLELIDSFPKQIEEAINLAGTTRIPGQIENIIIAGMGGSGHPGDILKAYADNINLKIPVSVIRDYNLPEFSTSKSLVFAISYSGNTEETISCLKNAMSKGTKTIIITSGGKLRSIAEENSIPLVLLPQGIQPRFAVGYMFFPMLKILSNSGLIKINETELTMSLKGLKSGLQKAQGKEIATKLSGKIPLIYSSSKLGIAAYIWKILINECAKTHAFSNIIPEMNHNEINAFRNMNAKFYGIFLQDEQDNSRIKLRISITMDVMSKSEVESTQIILKGSSFLAKMFTAIHTGMYVAYYLSIIYKTDPSPVPVIEDLKTRLKKNSPR